MRRRVIITISLIALLMFGWATFRHLERPQTVISPKKHVAAVASRMAIPTSSVVATKTPVISHVENVSMTTGPQVTSQDAYRLVMENGKCSLEAVERVTGDFRRMRHQEWRPGMFCCRLLNDKNEVLAEQTLPAPDHSCVVLDPNVPDEDGKPKAAEMTSTESVVFQVRFPIHTSATVMKVYRLAGMKPVKADIEPAGELLASIPLSQQ